MKVVNLFAAVLLPIVAGLTAGSVHAQQSNGPILWQDVQAGMSEAELRRLHPSIQQSDRGALVQNGVTVAGMSFNAYFQMSAGRVQAVQLQSTNANVQTLTDGLSAKYGASSSPYKCDAPNSPARKCTAVWSASGGVAITLTVFNAPGMSLAALKYEVANSNGL